MMNVLRVILIFSTLYFSTQAAVFEPHVLWSKSEVTVCFYDQASHITLTELRNLKRAKKNYKVIPGRMKKADQVRVKSFVQGAFSHNKSGIFFSGFKKCLNPVVSDVVVMTKDPFAMRASGAIKSFGRASIGEAGEITYRGRGFFSKKPGFYGGTGEKAYVYLASVDKTTTLHEFGHIAGLRHEHAREEAFNDSNCSKVRGHNHRGDPLKERLYITSEVPFAYDARSIMNYCYINPLRHKINSGGLSALSMKDYETLKEMYR